MSDRINDSLDTAIDRVATHLVSVREDGDAVRRIVASLPARRGPHWWSLTAWPLQAAALASVVLVLVYWPGTHETAESARDRAEGVAMLDVRPMTEVAELRQAARRVEAAGARRSFSPVSTLARDANAGDASGELFGLSPIVVPDSLSIPTLQSTAPLATIEPATLAPISLSELPLTDDALPPSSKE